MAVGGMAGKKPKWLNVDREGRTVTREAIEASAVPLPESLKLSAQSFVKRLAVLTLTVMSTGSSVVSQFTEAGVVYEAARLMGVLTFLSGNDTVRVKSIYPADDTHVLEAQGSPQPPSGESAARQRQPAAGSRSPPDGDQCASAADKPASAAQQIPGTSPAAAAAAPDADSPPSWKQRGKGHGLSLYPESYTKIEKSCNFVDLAVNKPLEDGTVVSRGTIEFKKYLMPRLSEHLIQAESQCLTAGLNNAKQGYYGAVRAVLLDGKRVIEGVFRPDKERTKAKLLQRGADNARHVDLHGIFEWEWFAEAFLPGFQPRPGQSALYYDALQVVLCGVLPELRCAQEDELTQLLEGAANGASKGLALQLKCLDLDQDDLLGPLWAGLVNGSISTGAALDAALHCGLNQPVLPRRVEVGTSSGPATAIVRTESDHAQSGDDEPIAKRQKTSREVVTPPSLNAEVIAIVDGFNFTDDKMRRPFVREAVLETLRSLYCSDLSMLQLTEPQLLQDACSMHVHLNAWKLLQGIAEVQLRNKVA